ncbi:glycosyltransferase family 2 protein [Microbacterium caowuchunii]|uniref:Glycosyltransferase family 2 protein n=1 Tax=Microbacterium caowuchunii TaxID=2614638 RepID=A0A5N0TD38_9MICO|nr:glycosyltransferase family A protein [Microbacterium caowuchunii]KAA9132915.1 glycosyltransferase family 2 protein [Microbacterium caowuchunii]
MMDPGMGPSRARTESLRAAIVVCTRDRASMLHEALRALRRAVPEDGEIVVVDSGSRDDRTRRVAELEGVRYVRSDVPGLSIARNAGLRATDGDIVVFTDDDAAVDPGFLAPLLHAFDAPAVAAATGSLHDIDAPRAASTTGTAILSRPADGLDAGHGALMAFRRTTILDAGGFDPVLGAGRRFGGAEDMDAFCRLLLQGHEIARVPASVVTHRHTREDDDYIALNTGYGLGMGALCAKLLRTAGWRGATVAGVVLRRGLVRYARRIRSRRTRRGQGAFLRGVFRGLLAAWRMPIRDHVFVDAAPPAPVLIDAAGRARPEESRE